MILEMLILDLVEIRLSLSLPSSNSPEYHSQLSNVAFIACNCAIRDICYNNHPIKK